MREILNIHFLTKHFIASGCESQRKETTCPLSQLFDLPNPSVPRDCPDDPVNKSFWYPALSPLTPSYSAQLEHMSEAAKTARPRGKDGIVPATTYIYIYIVVSGSCKTKRGQNGSSKLAKIGPAPIVVSWYVHTFHPNMSYPQKSHPAYDKHNITSARTRTHSFACSGKNATASWRAACWCMWLHLHPGYKHNQT